MTKTITRVIPRTRVTAEFVNPVTKEFYDADYVYNGAFVKSGKVKKLINNSLTGENHPILTKIYKVVHETVRYTMPIQVFCNNAKPEIITSSEEEEE